LNSAEMQRRQRAGAEQSVLGPEARNLGRHRLVEPAVPPARGGLVGSNVNTSNKEASLRGFEFLDNVGDHPDPAKSQHGAGPLEDRGGVDDATILATLPAARRSSWTPVATPAGQTDIRLYRVIATAAVAQRSRCVP